MRITFTQAEVEGLLKQALMDHHAELLKEAGMGYLEPEKIQLNLKGYGEEYLVASPAPTEPNKPITQE